MREEFIITRQGKLCECGCGRPAPVAQRNDAAKGYVKGQPTRFIRGHANRKNIPDYTVDDNGCWIWQRGLNSFSGYGMLGRQWAHRVVYEREFGPIPEGLELDHLCRVRACVNPVHLEPVTKNENAKRGLTGRHPKLGARRLSEAEIRDIRASGKSNRGLAQQYAVSHETIRCVKSGIHYAEVAS